MGEIIAEGFAKFSQIEMTPIAKTELSQSLKDDFSKDLSNQKYTYVKKKLKSVDVNIVIPIPGKSKVNVYDKGFEVINEKDGFLIMCHAGILIESNLYKAHMDIMYGKYKEIKNWGESSDVKLVNGVPLFNLNTLTVYAEGDQSYASYSNFTTFMDPENEVVYGCFSKTSNKQLLVSFTEKLMKKNLSKQK